MLISHKYRFIFLKPTKVGGSSVEAVLANELGFFDTVPPSEHYSDGQDFEGIRARNFRLLPRLSDPWRQIGLLTRGQPLDSFGAHTTAKFVKKSLPNSVWNSYLKISIFRNPFDRAVSWYFWNSKAGYSAGVGFEEFLNRRMDLIASYRRQTYIDNQYIVDFPLRYENLNEDFSELARNLGLPSRAVSLLQETRLKSTSRPAWASTSQMFSELPQKVKEISETCNPEIERFGYEPPTCD